MTDTKEIYKLARLLISQHGKGAEDVVNWRISEAIEKGNENENVVWLNVIDAIKDLNGLKVGNDQI